jgi:hypothetical protein
LGAGRNDTRTRRLVLSAFLSFHLFCILLAPNRGTYLGAAFSRWVEPYVDFLGLGWGWSFFAPEPGPPPTFIEWHAQDAKGRGLSDGSFPSREETFLLRERQNQRVSVARYAAMSEEGVRSLFGPWLCARTPGASRVELWRAVEPIPSLQEITLGKRAIFGAIERRRDSVGRFDCSPR